MAENPETLDEALERISELEAKLEEQGDANADVLDQQWPVEVELSKPIKLGSKSWEAMTIREPVMGDLTGLPVNPQQWTFDHMIAAGARIAGIPGAAVRKLAPKDAALLNGIVRRFFLQSL